MTDPRQLTPFAAACTAGEMCAVLAVAAALDATHDPAPDTTTVTTAVAPCDRPACPPWPSLDQGDEDQ